MIAEIWTITRKELSRFFSDRRLVLSVLMPGLVIYFLYSAMGSGYSSINSDSDTYKVTAVNMPSDMDIYKGIERFEVNELDSIDSEKLSKSKKQIEDEELDLLVVFPEGFESNATDGDNSTAPNIEIFYNSVNTASSQAYSMTTEILNATESQICNAFDININPDVEYDMATEEEGIMSFFSTMLPMILLIFIFSGCMTIASESIAGEKERGTLAKLLVTPTRHSSIAFGKILGLSVIGLLSGLSSFWGIMFSLPKMVQGMTQSDSVSALMYGPKEYLMLFFVIISTVLVIVGILSVISSFAKSVKEASLYATPLMIVVSLLGLSSMFIEFDEVSLVQYAIPVFNSVMCMTGIFNCELEVISVVITVLSNLLVTAILVALLSRMFKSEKIVY